MLSRFAKLTTMIATMALMTFVLFPSVSNGQGNDRLARGRQLYIQHCASCHGMDAKGNGPVASELKTAPSNLTTIAQRHGGKFDSIHVQLNIDGEKEVPAHGSRDMPVWGAYFRSTKGESYSKMNVYALAEYLKAVQVR